MPCTRSEQNCNLSAFNLSTLTSVSDCSVPATRSGDFFVFQKHRCIKILQFLSSKHSKTKHKYNKNDKRGFRRRKPPEPAPRGFPYPYILGLWAGVEPACVPTLLIVSGTPLPDIHSRTGVSRSVLTSYRCLAKRAAEGSRTLLCGQIIGMPDCKAVREILPCSTPLLQYAASSETFWL